jgi:hypothetical protein
MVDPDEYEPVGDEPAPMAVRLTFRYEGEEVELLTVRRVQKALPPSESRDNWQDRIGWWIEVRDAAGRALDRRVLFDPVRADAEVYPEGLGEPITRVPLDTPSGVFSVLVPDLENADHLSLLRSSPTDREALGGPNELVRVALHPEGQSPREEES